MSLIDHNLKGKDLLELGIQVREDFLSKQAAYLKADEEYKAAKKALLTFNAEYGRVFDVLNEDG